MKLTRDEREMIHIAAMITFIFTLIGTAVVICVLTIS